MTINDNRDGGIAELRKRRSLSSPKMRFIVTALTVALACFHLYTSFFGLLPPMQQRSFHIGMVLFLIFMLYPGRRNSPPDRPSVFDWLWGFVALTCCFYVFFRYSDIANRAGMFESYEIVLGVFMTVTVFEAARRVLGYSLPIFCFLFLLFAYFGRSLPGPLMHFGLSVPRIIEELYLTSGGFFGLVAGVSATYIFLFILFGAFLSATKTSDFFNEFAMALTGHMKGGPAKIAVLSSALMGTISGSTSANVATTGSFTIPLMKGIGYKPHFAGAVEAAASTGGQIMPPVMGAAAFIIADTLGISYTKVLLAAVVPATLYFGGIWFSLSLEACRLGLKGLPKEELPDLKSTVISKGYRALPLFGIVYFLVEGYNPLYAGCWGIILAFLLSFLRKDSRLNVRDLVDTLEAGSKSALPVALACTIVGVVIGMMGATGIALRVGDAILALTGGHLLPTLVVSMIIALLMGMGMPTTASYVMSSAVAAPALITLGAGELDVNLFVLYFAVLSSITPPVCVGAYTAAGIAESNPNRTGFSAIKLALAGFVIPFAFMYSPELLLTNVHSWSLFALSAVTAVIGVYSLAVFTEGFFLLNLGWIERLVALVASMALIVSGTWTDMVGVALLSGLYLYQRFQMRRCVSETETIVS
ncbi:MULTISPECIES: TRAP transporter permease [Dethiosulfovibrio]|uniref:TRAP transporter permease n=2 Tax=Dethiosulfovibrio TaxID=47054 RepID=A0ABS9EM52_9BACT|nr:MULTISPECIES: TRAP transporter permease [Dethiosulfovibrio]MCF4113219.1 TRAP transporter permease [Dethiosulfovibrio russensis]MCF4142283.1 TRAP transporter permease [Dethiosulfovibrio marinus]MCF4144591.1 TRAP transporter permease [Dethiosulfovibrio acidaminovorans]